MKVVVEWFSIEDKPLPPDSRVMVWVECKYCRSQEPHSHMLVSTEYTKHGPDIVQTNHKGEICNPYGVKITKWAYLPEG